MRPCAEAIADMAVSKWPSSHQGLRSLLLQITHNSTPGLCSSEARARRRLYYIG